MRRYGWIPMVVVLLLAIGGTSWWVMTDKRPKRVAGGLTATSNEQMQHEPCAGRAPADAYTLYLGDAALWFRTLPHTVVTAGGAPQLIIKAANDNALAVELGLYSGRQQLGRLDGVTLTNNAAELRVARPSGSELQVFAADGSLIAQIDRTSLRVLRLTGHLTFGAQDFVITSDQFVQNGSAIGAVCLGGDKQADFTL